MPIYKLLTDKTYGAFTDDSGTGASTKDLAILVDGSQFPVAQRDADDISAGVAIAGLLGSLVVHREAVGMKCVMGSSRLLRRRRTVARI